MTSATELPFNVEALAPDLGFGRRVTGLTRLHLDDPSVRAALREIWIRHGLILFQLDEIDEAFHVEISRMFGPLEVHPIATVRSEGNPELITITSSRNIMEVDGVIGAGHLGWHTDLCYVERINHGGILRALKLSDSGGVTGFIDQIDAYDRLPARLKARIEDLHVVYQVGPFDSFQYGTRGKLRLVSIVEGIKSVWDRADADFPPVAHPMLFVQPETGRKLLNISPYFAIAVEGLDAGESHALLSEISDHIAACPAYHHRWSHKDLILWDNWRMLHSVTQIPLDQERVMQRTTIEGDYGVGRRARHGRLASA
jgi:taurine dioxygenase